MTLRTKAYTLFSSNYHPEVDSFTKLNDDNTRLSQEWASVLRWAVELVRIDIQLEVSLILSHTSNQRTVNFFLILKILSGRKEFLRCLFSVIFLDSRAIINRQKIKLKVSRENRK